MSDVTGERAGDTGPWPQWHPTPTPVALISPDNTATQLENTRAGLAQLSALIPLVGPGIAFAASRHGSAARRQAAKAFNGQVTAAVVSAAALVPTTLIYFSSVPHYDLHAFYGLPAAASTVFLSWLIQATIATVAAFGGRDWTSPLTRLLHTEILPEHKQP